MTRARHTRSIRAFALLSVGVGLCLSNGVHAGEPDTWSMSRAQLRALGLGQSRGAPVPVPEDAPRLRSSTQPQAHASPGTIFVNFEGAVLSSGFDDAQNNVTQISNLAGNFAAYGVGSKREAVMQALQTDWAAYDIALTDTRPGTGEYTMNMIGPTNPFGGGVLGIAPLDCFDSQTHSNITFAFHSANDSFSAAVQATTVSQEVAHSYGLEHVDAPGDIMNPFNAGGDASFLDTCIPIVSNGQPIACGPQHAEHCSGGTSQNAHLELLDLFGTAVPDTAAPTVAISFPGDGDVFEPGSAFTIMVEASDDIGVTTVQLFNNGTPLQSDSSEPFGWDVDNIPAGEYELYVVAADAVGNETTSETITIYVGDPPASGSTGESGSGSGGGDDEDIGDTEGGDTPGQDGDAPDAGCGCSQSAPEGSLLLLLGVFGFLRRRCTPVRQPWPPLGRTGLRPRPLASHTAR